MLGLVLWVTVGSWWGAPPGVEGAELEAPAETSCRVAVAGIPRSVRPEHELIWPGGRSGLDEVVDVRFRGSRTHVVVRGPRFGGEADLDAATCPSEVRTVQARPRPAQIEFHCAPPGLVIRCRGCPGAQGQWIPAQKFPALAVEGYANEFVFELMAAGFRPSTRRVVVYPGANIFEVDLERLP